MRKRPEKNARAFIFAPALHKKRDHFQVQRDLDITTTILTRVFEKKRRENRETERVQPTSKRKKHSVSKKKDVAVVKKTLKKITEFLLLRETNEKTTKKKWRNRQNGS